MTSLWCCGPRQSEAPVKLVRFNNAGGAKHAQSSPMLTDVEGRILYKPCDDKELQFYLSVQQWGLQELVPKYEGAYEVLSIGEGFIQGSQVLGKEQKASHIALESICAGMQSPQSLDLKLGDRPVGSYSGEPGHKELKQLIEAKLQEQDATDLATVKASLSSKKLKLLASLSQPGSILDIAGLGSQFDGTELELAYAELLLDAYPDKKMQIAKWKDRWGKDFDAKGLHKLLRQQSTISICPSQASHGIRIMGTTSGIQEKDAADLDIDGVRKVFFDWLPHDPRQRKTVTEQLVNEVMKLEAWADQNTLVRLYACSLLFVYDAVPGNASAKVKLIDFAHVHPGGKDEGLLKGVSSARKILQSIDQELPDDL